MVDKHQIRCEFREMGMNNYTSEQHVEVCIDILNMIAYKDGLDTDERIDLGIHPEGGSETFGSILCYLYRTGISQGPCEGKGYSEKCPGRSICKKNERRYPEKSILTREELVNAFIHHARRVKS